MASIGELTPAPCLAGGGEMGALIRSIDWSRTPLGPVPDWPHPLQTVVSICLASRLPIVIRCGPDYVMLYNDAYRAIIGDKHPAALGARTCDAFPEIWDAIGPMLDSVYQSGEAAWSNDLLLGINRHGFTEESYSTASYSPIRTEVSIVGIFTTGIETTERVVGERRMRLLRDVADATTGARTAADACVAAAMNLETDPHDIPFALLYLAEPAGGFRLQAMAGFKPNDVEAIRLIGPGSTNSPFAIPTTGHVAEIVERIDDKIPGRTACPWPEPPERALLVPLGRHGFAQPDGLLLAGLSPRRPFDESTRCFVELLGREIGTAIVNARAFDDERSRAENLAELDKAKSAFFSNVSHELRAPLTLIMAPVRQLLDDPSLDPAARHKLDAVLRNSRMLVRHVNDLLDLARIESSFLHEDSMPLEEDLANSMTAIASQIVMLVERRRPDDERREALDRERATRKDAEATAARLERVYELTDSALTHLRLADLLSTLLAKIRSMLEVDAATVLLLADDGETLIVRASDGVLSRGPGLATRVAFGTGLAGRIAAERQAIAVEDLAEHARDRRLLREEFKSFLGVPLIVQDQVRGVLHVMSERRRRFTDEEQKLLQIVADRVAPAIDRADLLDRMRLAQSRLETLSARMLHIQEDERRHLARELHDEIGQVLTGLKLLVEAAQRKLGHTAPLQLDQAKQVIHETLQRIRELSLRLRPPMLDDAGLVPMLEWHAMRFAEQSGLTIGVVAHGDVRRLEPDLGLTAFRIVQEALTNVARHAPGAATRILVEFGETELTVEISDEGPGFDYATVREVISGGIPGMRERTRIQGGRLAITSAEGHGTAVTATFPIPATPHGDPGK